MEKLQLIAKTREEKGKKVNALRTNGFIPAVVYGPDAKNQFLTLDYIGFKKLYDQVGESSVIDLMIDDKKGLKVLVQDVTYDPITENISHVDFYQFKAGQKLTADIELEFIGESRAVKDFSGVLFKGLDSVEVECLPEDLVSKIEIDLSLLSSFDVKILVKDIPVPKGIRILNDENIVVAKVDEPRSEEELKGLETAVVEDVAKVEKVEEKKETEEDGEAEAEKK